MNPIAGGTHMKEKPDYGRRKEDGLEVSGPGGWGLKANGSMVSVVVIIVGCAVAGLYMLREHDMQAKARSENINRQVGELKDAIEAQTYVLTLSEAQRKELKLDMPETLRRKVRGYSVEGR